MAETATANYCDLLLGEAPEIEAPAIYPIPDEELFIDVSRAGLGLLQIDASGIGVLNPENVYLVVDPSDIRKCTAYVIFHEFKQKDKQYVKLTIHQPGTIQHIVFWVKDNKLKQIIPLNAFPAYAGIQNVDKNGIQRTGINELLVVRVDNALSSERYYGRSDYTPAVHTFIEALDFAFARRAEVLAKFSRPVPMVPESAMQFDHASQKWVFKTTDAIILKEGQPSAQYLTWSAALSDVEQEIKDLFDQLLMKLKLSRVLLAGENQGQAESGTALKIRLIPTLSKVRKFASAYKQIVPVTLSRKAKLDVALGVEGAVAFEPSDVIITMQDGVLNLPLEDAQLNLVNSQVISNLKMAEIIDSKTSMRAAILAGVLDPRALMPLEDAEAEGAIETAAGTVADQSERMV